MTIGVVGMGIAGLRTAMLLESQGHTVKLFEARDRIGGRLQTWTDSTDGTVYEAGGEWIDSDHRRVLALLREFELGTIASRDWPRRLEFRGDVRYDDNLWPEALEDDLRLEAAAIDLCRNLRNPPWLNSREIESDHRPLHEFVRLHSKSDVGRWYLTNRLRSDEGDDLEKIGLLGWLAGYTHYLDRTENAMSAFRFEGGVRQLLERMRDSLRGEIVYGAKLRKVENLSNGVMLRFEGFDEPVDRAVLTLPPLPLEQVVFEPALDVKKRCAIEACEMSPIVKISWQFDHPWWLDRGWSGSMHCDGPLQQTWDATLGDTPILTAYICGIEAQRWVELNEPVRAGLYVLSKMFPEAEERYVRGWFHNWVSDPFARGGFSHLAPGYVLDHMASIAPSEGRVHFAGEHTALWTGFIEGALESAERVSAEIASL